MRFKPTTKTYERDSSQAILGAFRTQGGAHYLRTLLGMHPTEETVNAVQRVMDDNCAEMICEALDVPYRSPEMFGHTRAATLFEALQWVADEHKARIDFLERLLEVDPEWIDKGRRGERRNG